MIDNVYDIRYQENLYYILPKDTIKKTENSELSSHSIAVLVNLYYLDDVDWYLNYLKRLPENITIIVFSSNNKLVQYVRQTFMGRANFLALKKENRGRDISAFLIEGRKYFRDYDYVCFIHDKRWRVPEEKKETLIWRWNLWDNMLASKEYVANVIHLMDTNKEIGLLCPPEPIGEGMRAWYYSAWDDCFEETKKVAGILNLKADISRAKPPISLSTVFWYRKKALAKLLDYPWKYEDFCAEPLPKSGTISHGIERVLAYVAQDAGFKTGMIMTDEYAAYLLSFLQYHVQNTFSFLEDYHMPNFRHIEISQVNKKRIIEYYDHHERVYLYGAGIVGKRALKKLREWNCEPKGFIVTDMQAETEWEGVHVYPLNQLRISAETGIIITVSEKFRKEIIDQLETMGIEDYYSWNN